MTISEAAKTMAELLPFIITAGLTALSGICGLSVKVLWRLSDNVAKLNESVAALIRDTHNWKERMDAMEGDMRDVTKRMNLVEREVSANFRIPR